MKLIDYPMNCCGMVEASGIGVNGHYNEQLREFYYDDADWDLLFKRIEEHQLKHRRNCALISLSEEQDRAREAAEKRGWGKVFEFYNPNSSNMVALYTKVLWESSAAYKNAEKEGYKEPFPRSNWTRAQPEAIYEV